MNVFIENFDIKSDTGPNGFTRKLFDNLIINDLVKITDYENSQISFCLIESILEKNKPRILRLDGIYFNTKQDFERLNDQIKKTYENADAVVFQTDFNRSLIETWFGKHNNGQVIRNGTSIHAIDKIPKIKHPIIDIFSEVWTCAAAWRPHKRLNENIRYFLEHAPSTACLIIMGKDAEPWLISHPRIFYAGHVSWEIQISLYKQSSTFLHLAWLDHCPNVVVDARACGCKIICSSAGGTQEIAGKNSLILKEETWDFNPVDLYSPPKIDFSNKVEGRIESEIDISKVSLSYYNFMNKALGL